MYHSITFYPFDSDISYNTWDDWRLIPTKRPHVGPPEMEYLNQIELSSYKSLDLQYINKVKGIFKSRSASWEFAVDHNAFSKKYNWANLYNNILTYIHGKIGRFVLEDWPEYYYIGRFEVKDWDSQDNYSVITIEALCEPYAYLLNNGTSSATYHNMAGKSRTIDYTIPYGQEVPIKLSIDVKENKEALYVYGLFTNASTRSRDDQYIGITNVEEGHTYEINGEDKTIIDVNNSTGVRQAAMYKIGHMVSFPTLIDGQNKLIIRGNPAFSDASKVDVTLSIVKRLM